jgi:hypothetical protein
MKPRTLHLLYLTAVAIQFGVLVILVNTRADSSVQKSSSGASQSLRSEADALRSRVAVLEEQLSKMRATYDEAESDNMKLLAALKANLVKSSLLEAKDMKPAATPFHSKFSSAAFLAQKGEFALAIRLLNEATQCRLPGELAPEGHEELKALLIGQNRIIDVSFVSDGRTRVEISGRQLKPFDNTTVKLLPGDYLVTGRRDGFVDRAFILKLRNDEPPGTIAVVCSIPRI